MVQAFKGKGSKLKTETWYNYNVFSIREMTLAEFKLNFRAHIYHLLGIEKSQGKSFKRLEVLFFRRDLKNKNASIFLFQRFLVINFLDVCLLLGTGPLCLRVAQTRTLIGFNKSFQKWYIL